MARRTPGPAKPAARKRLMVLGGVAAVAVLLVGVALVQANRDSNRKAEQEKLLSALDEEQPDFNYYIGPDGKPSKASDPSSVSGDSASTGSGNAASPKKNGPGDSRASGNGSAADPTQPEETDTDYPSSGGAGSTNKSSAEHQVIGERILMEVQEGATGDTIIDRDIALRKAISAFDSSVKADNENAASYWGLGFSQINLAAGFFATPNKKDDSQWSKYAKRAVANAERSMALSKDNNIKVFELASTLKNGIDLERKGR